MELNECICCWTVDRLLPLLIKFDLWINQSNNEIISEEDDKKRKDCGSIMMHWNPLGPIVALQKNQPIDLLTNFYHCVKIVRIWSFSGPYFSAFGLNTKIYFVNICFQSKCGKIWTRKLRIQAILYSVHHGKTDLKWTSMTRANNSQGLM